MIISGGSRRSGAFFAKHLMRADENELVAVTEIRGLASDNIRDAFREMEALASGTRARNYFYHVNLNPRAHEHLTPEQWEHAIDTLEKNLGLEGHSRFVIRHEKNGRIHQHVVWSRIDPETMTAVSDSKNYAAHERTARELEREFGHEPVQGVHVELDGSDRAERRPKNWETFRGHESGIDPEQVKAQLTSLWERADTGLAFKAALEDAGYVLCRGDRRDFVVIEQAGDEHSLTRRIKGARAAAVRARMGDIDRDSLPSVAKGRMLARDALKAADGWQRDGVEIEPGSPSRSRALDERLAGDFFTEPKAEITGGIARDLAARFGEAMPGDHDEWESETSRKAGGTTRSTSWGTTWRTFADRVSRFAEAVYGLWRDERSGAAYDQSWTDRFAHLAVTGVRAIAGRNDARKWGRFIEESIAVARDWTASKNTEGQSWQERTRRPATEPHVSPPMTRDPYEAMVKAMRNDKTCPDPENTSDPPEPPSPDREGPDLG